MFLVLTCSVVSAIAAIFLGSKVYFGALGLLVSLGLSGLQLQAALLAVFAGWCWSTVGVFLILAWLLQGKGVQAIVPLGLWFLFGTLSALRYLSLMVS